MRVCKVAGLGRPEFVSMCNHMLFMRLVFLFPGLSQVVCSYNFRFSWVNLKCGSGWISKSVTWQIISWIDWDPGKQAFT